VRARVGGSVSALVVPQLQGLGARRRPVRRAPTAAAGSQGERQDRQRGDQRGDQARALACAQHVMQ